MIFADKAKDIGYLAWKTSALPHHQLLIEEHNSKSQKIDSPLFIPFLLFTPLFLKV